MISFLLPKVSGFSFHRVGRVDSHGNLLGTKFISTSEQLSFPVYILWGGEQRIRLCSGGGERIFLGGAVAGLHNFDL